MDLLPAAANPNPAMAAKHAARVEARVAAKAKKTALLFAKTVLPTAMLAATATAAAASLSPPVNN